MFVLAFVDRLKPSDWLISCLRKSGACHMMQISFARSCSPNHHHHQVVCMIHGRATTGHHFRTQTDRKSAGHHCSKREGSSPANYLCTKTRTLATLWVTRLCPMFVARLTPVPLSTKQPPLSFAYTVQCTLFWPKQLQACRAHFNHKN